MTKKLTKQTMLQGAFVLAAAAIVVRVLGAAYRIPLGRILGDEGMGIYSIPNQIFYLFYTISSAGIPVGVASLISSKMASGLYKDAYRAFKAALWAMLGTGLVFSSVLFFGAGWLIDLGLVSNPNCYWGLKAIAPVVFFGAVVAAFRGLFQGLQNMTTVAWSQVADQLFLVTGTLLFSCLLIDYGLSYGAAGANLGSLCGVIASTLVLVFFFRRAKPHLKSLMLPEQAAEPEKYRSLLKKVLAVSVPISLASISMSIANILDNVIVINRLQLCGYTLSEATAFYGQFTQYAMSFVNLSIVFSLSMGTSMVPFVSEAFTLKKYDDIRQKLSQSLRLSVLTSLPAATGLLVLASPLTLWIYNSEPAGVPLACITPAILFWGINLVLSGTLQGAGKPGIPVRNLLIGLMAKVAITYFLTPTVLEIRAAALGTSSVFLIASALNILSIHRLIGFSFPLVQGLLRPALATTIMGLAVWKIYAWILAGLGNYILAILLAIGAGAAIYGLAVILLGALNSEDAQRLPKIGRQAAGIIGRWEQLKAGWFKRS
ncbi:MAG: polysaccharide biosynthesis protein [Clostridia bacterium]|nr:polysaccharide biosynthesis protein [Clostridia bacterium]